MDHYDTKSGSRVRVVLTDEELGLPAIDDLCNKYFDWLKLSKESADGRKTRSANRRADTIFDEILAFKLPPIRLTPLAANTNCTTPVKSSIQATSNSTKSSVDGDSETSSLGSSSGQARTLRPRCRTPSVSRHPQPTPSTPTQQSLRAHMKKNPDSGSSSVLTAALNQQHPSVSVTKIRQLLRADSAQKKRDEERERQEKARQERKAKEERAEAQKKQLLEERAITAKVQREQRLQRAAEVRKAREKQRVVQKLKDDHKKTTKSNHLTEATITVESSPECKQVQKLEKHPSKEKISTQQQPPPQPIPAAAQPAEIKDNNSNKQNHKKNDETIDIVTESTPAVKPQAAKPLDETFKKPSTNEQNNIDISVHDETTDSHGKPKGAVVATWAKAPYLRDAVISQFSKPEAVLLKMAYEIFKGEKLKEPVDLTEIFGANRKYLPRSSSAVWSPPNRALKRASSMVMTPTNDTKR